MRFRWLEVWGSETCQYTGIMCLPFDAVLWLGRFDFVFVSPSDRNFITRESMEVVKKAELVG